MSSIETSSYALPPKCERPSSTSCARRSSTSSRWRGGRGEERVSRTRRARGLFACFTARFAVLRDFASAPPVRIAEKASALLTDVQQAVWLLNTVQQGVEDGADATDPEGRLRGRLETLVRRER